MVTQSGGLRRISCSGEGGWLVEEGTRMEEQIGADRNDLNPKELHSSRPREERRRLRTHAISGSSVQANLGIAIWFL